MVQAKAPTNTDIWMAKQASGPVDISEDISKSMDASDAAAFRAGGAELKGTVTSTRWGTVRMWYLGKNGWAPITVSASMIRDNLASGRLPACGDCGEEDCAGLYVAPDGRQGYDPNKCPGKERVMFRRCPTCDKKLWDNDMTQNRGTTDDGNEIQDDEFAASTPELRTRGALRIHMLEYHKSDALALGIAPMPVGI